MFAETQRESIAIQFSHVKIFLLQHYHFPPRTHYGAQMHLFSCAAPNVPLLLCTSYTEQQKRWHRAMEIVNYSREFYTFLKEAGRSPFTAQTEGRFPCLKLLFSHSKAHGFLRVSSDFLPISLRGLAINTINSFNWRWILHCSLLFGVRFMRYQSHKSTNL